jgi:hypothetical protein
MRDLQTPKRGFATTQPSLDSGLELFDGVFLPVVSRTDAAISKLIWIYKGSQRSRRDFRSIFSSCSAQQQIDVRKQAAELNLSKLLDEVIVETDEIR